MKTICLLLFSLGLLISIFPQDDYRNRDFKHLQLDPKFSNKLTNHNNEGSHNLKIGNKDIPINSSNGQDPNERQLEIIKNLLTEDFLVNDDSGSTDQQTPSISMDRTDKFVIVWMDERNGNSDIYYQLYNANGVAQGINTKVNDDVGDASQWSPSISMDAVGNFVIVWQDFRNGNHSDVYLHRYDSSGTAQGMNIKANDAVGNTWQMSPSISMDALGNFVIVWEDERNNYRSDIYYQRYSSTGIAQGINTKVNDDLGDAWQFSPEISMVGGGNFVIVWEDLRNDVENPDIYFQRYSASGVTQGTNTKANDDVGTSTQSWPKIAIDGGDNFVIAWEDYRNDNWDIYCQRYNSSDLAQGINTKVNDNVGNNHQNSPSLEMDEEGNCVIVWLDNSGGYDYPKIIGQRYYANGGLNGNNYRIVALRSNYSPAVAANNSNIIFSWIGNRRLKGWDIYAKIVGWDWNGLTSVTQEGNDIPSEFSLSQNYPNPFNPSTKIRYAIPLLGGDERGGLVTLKVYDVLGNEIATLVNEEKPAGSYEVEFPNVGMRHASSATNVLPSGVYFYQLKAGPSSGSGQVFVETKKMILLR